MSETKEKTENLACQFAVFASGKMNDGEGETFVAILTDSLDIPVDEAQKLLNNFNNSRSSIVFKGSSDEVNQLERKIDGAKGITLGDVCFYIGNAPA